MRVFPAAESHSTPAAHPDGGAAGDVDRLRHFCRSILHLLDGPGDGSGGVSVLARGLAGVIEGATAEVADGLSREAAAYDTAISELRHLLPARYLTPPPAVAALLDELAVTRDLAVRAAGALEAFRSNRPVEVLLTPHPAAVRDFPRPATETAMHTPAGVTDTVIELPAAPTAEVPALAPVEPPPAPDTHRAADLYRAAEACHRRGELDRAEDLYTQAVGADPYFGPAYSRRGQVRLARRETDAAVADFDTALALDDTALEAWWWRGDAHAVAGRTAEAIADYRRALELNPGVTRARFNLGVAYRLHGEYKPALAELGRVLSDCPGHAGAHLNRGLIHEHLGEKAKAETEFRAALGADPDCRPAREHLDALAPPPLSPETAPGPKKDTGQVTVACPKCGEDGTVPWDRLGKVLACAGCGGRFGIRPGGEVVELEATRDGKWAPVRRAREERARRRKRLTGFALAAAAVLVLGLGMVGWRAARTASASTERELPRDLEARAELFTQAWLGNDVRTMRRLTSPVNDKALYAWYTRHRPPLELRDRPKADAGRVEVSSRAGPGGQSVVRVRIGPPADAPNRVATDLLLTWEDRGGEWYFLPPSK